MPLTQEQLKGRIRNIAKDNKADARILMRIHMMERLLERVSVSRYRDNFIIKGGILVTALVGLSLRSTMDIDTSLKNLNLTEEDAQRIITEIMHIDIGDSVTFEIKNTTTIMDEMEYPGIRITINALMGNLVTPIKVDISTGDIITPQPISYQYKLLLEDRYINLLSYNLETILAEKIQTVLERETLNTRMRDFYDIRTLFLMYGNQLNVNILMNAFNATCIQRESGYLVKDSLEIVSSIESDEHLRTLWGAYQMKYSYASDLSYETVIDSLKALCKIIRLNQSDSQKRIKENDIKNV